MAGKLYRHGDVLIQEVKALPEDVFQPPQSGEVILAHGEVTGHTHRIENPAVVEHWRVPGFNAGDYIRVLETTRLVHEEHQPITLEPGVYRFWQQREYAPTRERTRFHGGVSFRTVSD